MVFTRYHTIMTLLEALYGVRLSKLCRTHGAQVWTCCYYISFEQSPSTPLCYLFKHSVVSIF